MSNVRFVGLDVHKSSIVIAVADTDRSEPSVVCEIPHDIPRLVKELRKLGRGGAEIRACYEAGPTGFGLYRALLKAKIACTVIAPWCDATSIQSSSEMPCFAPVSGCR